MPETKRTIPPLYQRNFNKLKTEIYIEIEYENSYNFIVIFQY